jgi:hypothetical protein
MIARKPLFPQKLLQESEQETVAASNQVPTVGWVAELLKDSLSPVDGRVVMVKNSSCQLSTVFLFDGVMQGLPDHGLQKR